MKSKWRVDLLALRTVLRIVRDVDGFFTWITRLAIPPQYEIQGKCLKRGLCCHNIGVYLAKGLWRKKGLRKWIVAWYEFVYNFRLKAENEEAHVLIFHCQYLKDNKCSIYFRRPYICRQFPAPMRFFSAPQLLPGCGYSFKKRGE